MVRPHIGLRPETVLQRGVGNRYLSVQRELRRREHIAEGGRGAQEIREVAGEVAGLRVAEGVHLHAEALQ